MIESSRTYFFLCTLAIFLSVNATADEGTAEWRDRKWEAIWGSWKAWDSDAEKWLPEKDIRIDGRLIDLVDKSKVLDQFSAQGYRSNGHQLLDYRSDSLGRELFAINPKYVFSIKPLDAANVSDRWMVSGLSRPLDIKSPFLQKMNSYWDSNRGIWHPNQFSGFTLTVLSDPRWFRLKKLETKTVGILYLEFDIASDAVSECPQNYVKTVKEGWFELQDNSYECICAEFDLVSKGRQGKAEFANTLANSEGVVFASHRQMIECNDLRTGSGVSLEVTCSILPADMGIPRCFLPYYGLQEPEWAGGLSWTRVAFYGFVLILSVMGLWKIRHRSRF